MLPLHGELTAQVVEIFPLGVMLSTGSGESVFLDKTKTLEWIGLGQSLKEGDTIRVVVLDDKRGPCRVSALPEDFEIARLLSLGPSVRAARIVDQERGSAL